MTDATRAELLRAGEAAALGLIVGWVIARFARDRDAGLEQEGDTEGPTA